MPNHYPEHYPPKEKMLRVVIWQLFFFRDLSQNQKLSDIKPPFVVGLKVNIFLLMINDEDCFFRFQFHTFIFFFGFTLKV